VFHVDHRQFSFQPISASFNGHLYKMLIRRNDNRERHVSVQVCLAADRNIRRCILAKCYKYLCGEHSGLS